MTDLSGKTCVVTAAGQGIGRAIAKAIATAGAHVHATDLQADKLADLSADNIAVSPLDVRDSAAISEFYDKIGAVDILVNCAGTVHNGTVLDATEDEFDKAFDLNVKAMMRTIKVFLPGMLARGEGVILNMSSVASSIKGVPNRFVYSASKAAVIGLTKSVAADFIGQGIRCNAICPGTVDSPSLNERLAATGDYDAARRAFVARQPIGRIGTPEEIADLAVHLAGATYTTGQAYVIDGGWAM